ncbi:N-acetyltransferase [Striga asiatica]|uniref:N-alpha-acetyltransferase 40 n=1 Tax=Striga asiatica TaxID=4170 RepID=A0A5A7QK65_STRAF|nr:N-acetyltransferase [Striga asiatica]
MNNKIVPQIEIIVRVLRCLLPRKLPIQNSSSILEKKKATENAIRVASMIKDHTSKFPNFRHYQRNGLYAHLSAGRGNKLTLPTKQYIQKLLKVNMEVPFGPEWAAEEKIKRREMVAEEAHYIFVHEISNEDDSVVKRLKDEGRTCSCAGPIVGFVHYRFILEEEVPVVYVYELQLEAHIQGKGLGKFLMQLIEFIACENRMGAVVLTVQRANLAAMDFYIRKLGWDKREAMRFFVKHLIMKLKLSWRRPKMPQPTHEMLNSVRAHTIIRVLNENIVGHHLLNGFTSCHELASSKLWY